MDFKKINTEMEKNREVLKEHFRPTIINYSGASKMLTNDRTAIRSTYTGKKHEDAINELKEFEKAWTAKYRKH